MYSLHSRSNVGLCILCHGKQVDRCLTSGGSDLNATTLCLSDSLFGACDNRRSCKMLKLDNIFEVELPFGVVVDPSSWHVWYLEFITRTSSLKQGCEDDRLAAVSGWSGTGSLPGLYKALISAAGGVACQSIILTSSILQGDVGEAAKGYARAT